MNDPVLILSDTHYHKFSQYASIDANGVNSRLADTLRATEHAFRHAVAAGASHLIHCGDTFHVRGNISPTVLNPVRDLYNKRLPELVNAHFINGNHDLETNDSKYVASAAHSLSNPHRGIIVHSSPTWLNINGFFYAMVPWESDLTKLRATIKSMSDQRAQATLILHAPLNGVIKGLPDHGLNPEEFAEYDFQRVFCGHYHNHKDYKIDENKFVTSVGALTHQNWGDVDSLAGFVLYDPEGNRITHHETPAPKFRRVSVTKLEDHDDDWYTDNYVKVVDGEFTDPSEIDAIRNSLITKGAKAVVVEGLTRKPTASRGAHTTSSAPTLHTILGDYMDRQYPGDEASKIEALKILGEVL